MNRTKSSQIHHLTVKMKHDINDFLIIFEPAAKDLIFMVKFVAN
jgi:hypothetical protein